MEPFKNRKYQRRGAGFRSAAVSLFLLVGTLVAIQPISAAYALVNPAPVNLGTAGTFSVLAGSTVTNTGPTIVSADPGEGGNLGVSPGSAVTGFPPGLVVPPGTIHAGDSVAATAQGDLTIAYNDAASRPPDVIFPPVHDLVGQTFTAGVYNGPTSLALSGTVTLDGEGNPDSVFIFQAGSTLVTSASSTVLLTNGAEPCNVFWQVGSSATLGASSTFNGTIMALTSVTVGNSVDVEGRVLARNGAVTLDNDAIHTPDCEPDLASIGITKVADEHNVAHGDPAGFTITVSSDGPLPALDVTLDDPLPVGPGFVWVIDGGSGAAMCSISSNNLQCSFGTMAAGTSLTVHVSTPTGMPHSHARYWNTATVTTSNAGIAQASDYFRIRCPGIDIAASPDASPVPAGNPIGFTATATASAIRRASAKDVMVTSKLPKGSGLSWTIDAAGSDPGCSISAGTLTCDWGTVESGMSRYVHITSPTVQSGTVVLKATASASNVVNAKRTTATVDIT